MISGQILSKFRDFNDIFTIFLMKKTQWREKAEPLKLLDSTALFEVFPGLDV